MERREVVVLGAGMAGLAAARALADGGRDVLVLDKGRGLGGRMATRRTDHGPLDHGAPWLEARGEGFAAAIRAMVEADHAAPWAGPGHVGMPGMSGALRGMAWGLDRRQGWEAREARRRGGAWRVASAEGEVEAGTLVSTMPAPQALRLLGHEPGVSEALAPVRMAPCWTLLARVEGGPVPTLRGEGDVAWISDEGRKPGREPGGVVMQASAAWTRPRLEMGREETAGALVSLLSEALGGALAIPWASAHRWRFSQAEAPLGRPFLAAPGLRIGGDWCLGPRVEHAWASGTAIAADLLARPRAPA